MNNPYESPAESSQSESEKTTPWLTRQKLFWFGVASGLSGITLLNLSHHFVAPNQNPKKPPLLISLDHAVVWLAIGLVIIGILAYVLRFFFHDTKRKNYFSYRDQK